MVFHTPGNGFLKSPVLFYVTVYNRCLLVFTAENYCCGDISACNVTSSYKVELFVYLPFCDVR